MEKKLQKNISYELQFIDSTGFIGSSSWNLVNNLSKENKSIKYKYRHDDKNVRFVESNISIAIIHEF